MSTDPKAFSAGLLKTINDGRKPSYKNDPLDLTEEEKVEYESAVKTLAELSVKLEQSPNVGVRGLDIVVSAAVLAGINSPHSLVRLNEVLAHWGVQEMIQRMTGVVDDHGVPTNNNGSTDTKGHSGSGSLFD